MKSILGQEAEEAEAVVVEVLRLVPPAWGQVVEVVRRCPLSSHSWLPPWVPVRSALVAESEQARRQREPAPGYQPQQ